MQDKLVEIFKKAKYKSSPDLVFSVLTKIDTHEKRVAKLKLRIGAFIGLASLAGLIPVFEILLDNLAHSGFYEYFSLIFSDGSLILSYWKEFAFSLAESLPTTSIIFTLFLMFISLLSFRYVLKQINQNQFINFEPLSV
jgi:hypothetical protein